MSQSPPRSVTEELIDLSKLPFALGTPARERAARQASNRREPLQANAWRSPTAKGVDRSPWYATKIVPVLKATLAPNATVEILLHGSHCLFLSASESRPNRDVLRALPALTALATHIFNRSDDSHSGARVKEHVVNAMTMLLGEEPTFDGFVAFDGDWLSHVIPAALADRHATVVTAAARFVRRLSEITEPDDVARQIVINDEVFGAMLRRYESCEDTGVRLHLLCAFVNVTNDPRVHFFLARCQRLLQILLDEVFSGSVAGTKLAAARWATEVGGDDTHRSAKPSVGTTPTPGSPSASAVRLRPGLADVSPLHRYMDRSRAATRGTVTGTPRAYSGSLAAGVSPAALNRSAATSVVPVDPMTPRGRQLSSTATPSPRQPSRGGAAAVAASSIHRNADGAAAVAGGAPDEATANALLLCDLALRTFINLMSSELQCSEIRRLAPTLLQATVDCRAVPDEAVSTSATELLRRLHDLDSAQLDHEVALQVLQGRALAQQLRSRIPTMAPADDIITEADGGAASYLYTGDGQKVPLGLHLPSYLGGGSTSGRSTFAGGSDAPTAYSSRGMGSAVSLVRRALAEVKSMDVAGGPGEEEEARAV